MFQMMWQDKNNNNDNNNNNDVNDNDNNDGKYTHKWFHISCWSRLHVSDEDDDDDDDDVAVMFDVVETDP